MTDLPLFLRTCLAAFVWAASAAAAAAPPNVVVIISDDQAWYDHSFMRPREPAIDAMAGPTKDAVTGMRVRNLVRTPNVDALANEGLAYTRGYNPTSLCRPSLASIITGVYPYQHGITGNNEPLGQDTAYDSRILNVPSLPRTLGSERGYRSFQSGKWWQGHHSTGGFTQGDTANSTSTAYRPPQWGGALPSYAPARHGDWGLIAGRVDYVTGQAQPPAPVNHLNTIKTVTDFIDAQITAGKPFFVWYAPMMPHTPHYPPASMAQHYIDRGIDSRTAQYYANIELWDGSVGALMGFLKARGIDDNTLVIYVVDNGWVQDPAQPVTGDGYLGAANNGATSKSKRSAYDGGLRTPILVRWPAGMRQRGITAHTVTTPVSTVDIAATVLAAAGLAPPPSSWGVDLFDTSAVQARTTIYGDVYQHDVSTAAMANPSAGLRYGWVVRDGVKYIRRHVHAGGDMVFRLYDYQADPAGASVDPFETTNLIASNGALATELSSLHTAWYGDPAPPSTPPNDDFEAAITISESTLTTLAWNDHATTETGEPAAPGGGRSVWWRWTAPASGTITLDTRGSRIDTLLAVFAGATLQTLATVVFNDDDGSPGGASTVSFQADAGTTYAIAIDGKEGAAGALTLNSSFTAGPPPAASDGEVPLPPWSLALLGIGLLAALNRGAQRPPHGRA